jgi:hypothetical protein
MAAAVMPRRAGVLFELCDAVLCGDGLDLLCVGS